MPPGRFCAATVSLGLPPSLEPKPTTVRISSLVDPPPLEGVHVIENLNSASIVVYGFGAVIVIVCVSEMGSPWESAHTRRPKRFSSTNANALERSR